MTSQSQRRWRNNPNLGTASCDPSSPIVTISPHDAKRFFVEPASEDLLHDLLSCSAKSWNPEDSWTNEEKRFYEIDDRKRMLIPEGFLDLVVQRLREKQVPFDLQHQHRAMGLGRVYKNPQISDKFRDLELLSGFCRACILADEPADISHVAAAIGDMFPTAQIAVCTSSWKLAYQLQAQLSKHSQRLVVIHRNRYANRHWKNPENHVMQVMAGQANSGSAMRDYFDIRLDMGESLALSNSEALTPWFSDSMRVYSILPKREFSRYEVLRLIQVYSSNFVEIPAENVPPTVRFLRVPGGELMFPKGGSAFEFARDQIWHNEGRNQRIARLAEALRTGDAAALDELGVVVPEGLQEVLFSNPAPGISILVANATHGRQLQAQLPEFEFVHSTTSQSEYPSFDPAAPVIITHAAADTFGIASRVVIRADGGSGWPLQGEAFPLQQPDNGPAILFDIEDQGDPAVGSFWNSRLKTYNELGWNNPLQDSEKNQ